MNHENTIKTTLIVVSLPIVHSLLKDLTMQSYRRILRYNSTWYNFGIGLSPILPKCVF